MKHGYKYNITKLSKKKHSCSSTKRNMSVKKTKEAINIISNIRTNLYQNIYTLVTSDTKIWRQLGFLSNNSEIENFIEKIEKEINKIKSKDFDFDKYRKAIICILNKKVDKFKDEIVKNMFIAKLQNIVFILKEGKNDQEIKEVKDANKNIIR